MRYALYLVAVLFAGLPAIASAQDQPDRALQILYINCKKESGIDLGVCLGYLQGLADVMVGLGQLGAQARDGTPIETKICDANYTTGSLRQIFINWAEKYPQLWTEDKIYAAVAFVETWPCPKDLLPPP